MVNHTIHIKVDSSMAQGLKKLARKHNVPVGALVRDAISKSYQLELASLSIRQQRAVQAYLGGFISIGKVSEEMGMNVLEMRKWLLDHELDQNNVFTEMDSVNA